MADARFLQGKLRLADYEEVFASHGRDADASLIKGVEDSFMAWTAVADGQPFLLFGVAAPSSLSTTGVPWALGTDTTNRVGIAVVRQSRHYVKEMKRHFYRLENHTDDRHKVAHRWLRWCGFTIEEPEPWGVMGLPFRRFWME